jgi:IclR family KDG regulon transcriptional repressor
LESSTLKENQSVARVFQIIEVMAENKSSMRLSDIAAKLKLPSSTTLRFLATLMTYNYAKQDKDSLKYSLTLKLCRLGELVKSQVSIIDIVRPYLIELSAECKESACLAIEEDMMVVYIDVIEGQDNMLKAMQRIGHIAPLYCTGVGKLMLLDYDEEKLKTLVEKRELTAFTKNTITTYEGLRLELDRVRSRGYALDDEECEIGARCIAAPIRNYKGEIIACISISGPISRFGTDKVNETSKKVIAMAEKISDIEFSYAK